MRQLISSFGLAGALLISVDIEAVSLKAELLMPGGRLWKGQVMGRDGDWIEFSRGTKPIRIGTDRIKELVFEINVDIDKLNTMKHNREYERIISVLNRALAPFSEYSDITSNLTKFHALLMELHYKTGNYERTLEIAEEIAADAHNPDLQEKGRIYQALSLIHFGRSDETEALLAEYGWNEELDNTASPEKLYISAKLLILKKQYLKAMERIAKVVAFHSQDPDWMQPAELLCAEIYTKLGMYDSAEEVIRQISLLYKDTNEDDLARQLKIHIEKLRAEQHQKELL